MNQYQICWGLLGAGTAAGKNAPGLRKCPNSILEGIYNRTKEKAVVFAHRHSVAKVFSRLEDMLADRYIDIIYIATPPNTHKEFALKCLHAGKAIYLEKPLALTYAEALEIDALVKEKKLPAYVGFYRRALPKFLTIQGLLDSGTIGEIRMVRVTHWERAKEEERRGNLNWRLDKNISGGGKFRDLAVHTLDILEFYFGKIRDLNGQLGNRGKYYEADDTVTANFTFENGVMGIGSWCFVADKAVEEVVVIGEKGNLRFSVFGKEAVILERNGELELFHYKTPELIAVPYQTGIVKELLAMDKSHADWEQALDVMKWVDHLYQGT